MSLKSVKTFYILDLDRTLLDTVRSTHAYADIVAEHFPELAERLKKEFGYFEERGRTFSMRSFMKSKVTPEELDALERQYVETSVTSDFLNEGAHQLIEALQASGQAFGILSYGLDPEGQALKIKANRLSHIPFIITELKNKGKLITSWQKGDVFELPLEYQAVAETADEIVLIDDKAVSFESLPDGARGYWAKLPGNPYLGGTVPASVRVVESLTEIIKEENL